MGLPYRIVFEPLRRTEAIFLGRPYIGFEGWNRNRAPSLSTRVDPQQAGAVIDASWASRHRAGRGWTGTAKLTGTPVAALHFRSQAQGTVSLDHARSRGAYRSRQAEAIELGNEAPLSVDGGTGEFVDRRRVSVQWFAGTILTALCGAALMGGAVFTSLDGETNFAALPERVEVALRGALGVAGDRLGIARKSDRLPSAEEPSYTRQLIRVSTITRSGNHEVVRVRPFVRIAGNLSLTASSLSVDIPPFNPQRLLAEAAPGGGGLPENAPAAQPDAEVAFVMRELAPMMPKLRIALLTPQDEVLAHVQEAAEWSAKPSSQLASAGDITGIKLAYAGVGTADPYAGFEARIIPENITLLPKTTEHTTGGNPFNERAIVARKGDSVSAVLRDFGAAPDEIAALTKALGALGAEGALQEGHKLRLLLSPTPDSKRLQPVRVIIANETAVEAVAALSDTGKYVSVDTRNVDSEVADSGDDRSIAANAGPGVSLYQSVYETALRNQVPRPIIDDLIRIYSFDVDFQRKVQPGDSFEVMFAGEEEAPDGDRRTDVLFASLTLGGETKKLYRFQTPDDSVVDYYDESGKSAKKFLVRKPLADGTMRSGFGLRRHPILGYVKMHTGIDWAAGSGTPIYAAGNGVVERGGWESGYGKFILIRHHNGYETAYGHMSAYATGVHEGTQVRQGQVIGFVGSTGLSTGSHLHFEIRINGRFVDPMRIKLPRGRELQGRILAAFEQERANLDSILARRPSRVASSAR
jgi:murein DD-endopeptidase MepM/ murein hydrolase activator NlpD